VSRGYGLFGPNLYSDYGYRWLGTFSNTPDALCIHGPACSECKNAEAARKAKEAETKARSRKLRQEAMIAVYNAPNHPLLTAWVDTGREAIHGTAPGPDWALLARVAKALDVADARNNAPAVKP
jgi:hypothetical protein